MKSKRGAALGLAVFLLSGCASGGVKVEERQLSSFERGRTTYSQVIGQLGAPTANTLMNDGRRVIVYTFVQAQARPESFIPIVGIFVGGADSQATSASLIFDREGVLESYSSTQAQYGMGTGFASGSSSGGRVPDQPRATPEAPRTQVVDAPQKPASSPTTVSGKTCTHEELVQARIARMNGYTSGPQCANSP